MSLLLGCEIRDPCSRSTLVFYYFYILLPTVASMSPMPKSPLTRQSLYDLVWSRPMSGLAKDFGISDVALAKRCRVVDVPIPYRGYWARVAAGQTPPKLPLPIYRARMPSPTIAAPLKPPKEVFLDGQEPTVHLQGSGHPPSATSPADQRSLLDRIEALPLTPTISLADTYATVGRTAKQHKCLGRGAIALAANERTGPIVDLDLSKDTLARALLLADRFIRRASAIGWPLTDPAPPEPNAPRARTRATRAALDPPHPSSRIPEAGRGCPGIDRSGPEFCCEASRVWAW